MVNIPTTERKYEQIPQKVNSLQAYSSALLKPAQEYQQEIKRQQDIKINSNLMQAQVDADEFMRQHQLKYQANPNSPEAQAELKSGLQGIYNKYGESIDPMFRQKWQLASNKSQNAYQIVNNRWVEQQRMQNAKLDIADGMNAAYKLARSSGVQGNVEKGLVDYENSYNQLYAYAKENMGETNARALLADYEEQYVTSFIEGVASNNPQKALSLLENPEIAAAFKKKDAQEMMLKVVKKYDAMQKFNKKVSQYNNEYKISTELDNLDTAEALRFLEQNEGMVSTKYYKAKKKALMSSLGITAETQADEAAEIMLDIAGLPKEDGAEAYYTASNEILTKIEDKYADGLLSTSDRKKLVNQIAKGQGKNISALKDVGSGLKFWDFSYKDASEYIGERYSGANGNQILLEYFRQVDGKDLDNDQKKSLLNNLIKKESTVQLNKALSESEIMSFNTMEEAKQAFSQGKIKKGDKVIINGVKGTI
jgi:hypothetical protein